MACSRAVVSLFNKIQFLTPTLSLIGFTASQATLTLDNECTFPSQRVSLGGECNTVTDYNSD